MKHERNIEPPEILEFDHSPRMNIDFKMPKMKKRKSVFRYFLQFISLTIYVIGLITIAKFIIGLC